MKAEQINSNCVVSCCCIIKNNLFLGYAPKTFCRLGKYLLTTNSVYRLAVDTEDTKKTKGTGSVFEDLKI